MLGFSRYVILILTSFLIIAYTIGIANVWKGNYHSIFARMLLGSIEITSDNDKLYIGKIKLLTTFSY